MAVEKLSISFDAQLATAVRKAAAEDGVSVSSWLTEAALAKARQVHLRNALDAYAQEHGPLDDQEIALEIERAHRASRISGGRSSKRTGKKAA